MSGRWAAGVKALQSTVERNRSSSTHLPSPRPLPRLELRIPRSPHPLPPSLGMIPSTTPFQKEPGLPWGFPPETRDLLLVQLAKLSPPQPDLEASPVLHLLLPQPLHIPRVGSALGATHLRAVTVPSLQRMMVKALTLVASKTLPGRPFIPTWSKERFLIPASKLPQICHIWMSKTIS